MRLADEIQYRSLSAGGPGSGPHPGVLSRLGNLFHKKPPAAPAKQRIFTSPEEYNYYRDYAKKVGNDDPRHPANSAPEKHARMAEAGYRYVASWTPGWETSAKHLYKKAGENDRAFSTQLSLGDKITRRIGEPLAEEPTQRVAYKNPYPIWDPADLKREEHEMKLADEIEYGRLQAGGQGSGPKPGEPHPHTGHGGGGDPWAGGRTPQQAFNEHQKNFEEIHGKLAAKMKERAADFGKDSGNWERVADQSHINTHLAIALARAGDRSMVDKLGIAY